MANLGNTSGSALVKSAASIANTIADYQDKFAAQQWNDSAQTDADYQSYANYLQDRITKLQATPSITSASKALTLQSSLTSANRSYVSNSIQRSSQAIIEGSGTPTDKLDTIDNLYYQAVANGDENLAQNLQSQHDSLSQQIQYDATTAASTYSTDLKSSYNGALSALDNGLADINNTFKSGGEKDVNKALNDFATSQGTLLKSLGIDLPTGSTLTMANIAAAVVQAKIALNQSAAEQLTQSGDTTSAQSYTDAANNLQLGITKIQTAAGSMTAQDITTWEQNANLYRTGTDENGVNTLKENGVTGYKIINGQPIPQSEGNAQGSRAILTGKDGNFDTTAIAALKQAGLTITNKSGAGYTVQFTRNSDHWTQSGGSNADVKAGSTITLIPQSNGSFQFEKNGSIFTLGADTRGLIGLQQTSSNGSAKLIAGQYGFNKTYNTVVSSNPLSKIQSTQGIAKNATAPATNIVRPVAPSKIVPGTSAGQAVSQVLGAPTTSQRLPVPSTKPIVSTSIKPGTILTTAMQEQAQNAINAFKSLNSSSQLSTYNAIKTSAGYGNPYDQYKLTLLSGNGYTGQPALPSASMAKLPGGL